MRERSKSPQLPKAKNVIVRHMLVLSKVHNQLLVVKHVMVLSKV